MIQQEDIVAVGRIGRTHGLEGELVATCELQSLGLEGSPEFVVLEMDEIPVPFYVTEWTAKNEATVRLKLEGLDTEERARRVVGKTLYVERTTLPERQDDELMLEDLVGYRIEDTRTGRDRGEIRAIDDSTWNVLFLLDNDALLPAADELIESIDTQQHIVRMHVPEGI